MTDVRVIGDGFCAGMEVTMRQENLAGNPSKRPAELEDSAVDWSKEATWLLKSVLIRHGVSKSELIEKLREIGVYESPKGLEAKLRRGGFSVAYLLQCMNAVGINEVSPMIRKRLKN